MDGDTTTASVLDAKQAAALAGVSKNTIYRAIEDGCLKASTLGRSRGFRIRPEWVEEWIDSMLFEPNHEPNEPAPTAYAERAKRQQPRRGFLSP